MNFETSGSYAEGLDACDTLAAYRNSFLLPKNGQGGELVYLCGNSLGLQPKEAMAAVKLEFDDWAKLGVEAHFKGSNPWFHYHKFQNEDAAKLVGGLPHEVVVMNQLTVNLHLLMASFYRPTAERYKIIMEGGAFPSDMYMVQSQVEFHGFDYDDAVVEVFPREGEYTLRHEDILKAIEENGEETALVFFSGVQYYTGQAFDIPAITKAAHAVGAIAGWDLAHAAGNLLLELHAWNVDFAAWCSYKYLNSGPGNVGGVFIHERHGSNPDTKRFAGWWGHKEDERFLMQRGYLPEPGAAGWQLSNAPVFGMAVHRVSLGIFSKAGMPNLDEKTRQLNAYLRFMLAFARSENKALDFEIITPVNQGGSQLSLLTGDQGKTLFDHLEKEGIICDWREPNVIRMAPVALYNTYQDVWKTGMAFLNFKNKH